MNKYVLKWIYWMISNLWSDFLIMLIGIFSLRARIDYCKSFYPKQWEEAKIDDILDKINEALK